MKRYTFTITISGVGNTETQAWDSALEGLFLDPGVPDEKNIEVEHEDCGGKIKTVTTPDETGKSISEREECERCKELL